MGRDERASAAREAAMEADWETLIGPIRPFEAFIACPKCGFAKAHIEWCPGKSLTAGYRSQPCPMIGQHMHKQCGGCGWMWLERTLDDDETPPEMRVRHNPGAALAAILLRLDGKVDLPIEEVNAALRHRVGATVENGVMRVFALAPESESSLEGAS